jgi:hypothetical protein
MDKILNPDVGTLILGLFIIILRAPFIFAPRATGDFYLKLMSTNNRTRLFGLAFASFGAFLYFSSGMPSDWFFSYLLWAFGTLFIFMGVVGFVILAPLARYIVKTFLDGMDSTMRVLLGIFSTIIGGALVYIGIHFIFK